MKSLLRIGRWMMALAALAHVAAAATVETAFTTADSGVTISIVVDGKEVDNFVIGGTKIAFRDLPCGTTVNILASKPGRETYTDIRYLKCDEPATTVEIPALAERIVSLKVLAVPGATVRVLDLNNIPMGMALGQEGQSEFEFADLGDLKTVIITVEADGYDPYRSGPVDLLASGQTVANLSHFITPKKTGLAVSSTPPNASAAVVYADGERSTPVRTPAEIVVQPGKPFKLEVSMPGYARFDKDYRDGIAAGAFSPLDVQLIKVGGSLELNLGGPINLEGGRSLTVSLNGEVVELEPQVLQALARGEPGVIEVSALGPQELMIVHHDYLPFSTEVTIKDGVQARPDIRMVLRDGYISFPNVRSGKILGGRAAEFEVMLGRDIPAPAVDISGQTYYSVPANTRLKVLLRNKANVEETAEVMLEPVGPNEVRTYNNTIRLEPPPLPAPDKTPAQVMAELQEIQKEYRKNSRTFKPLPLDQEPALTNRVAGYEATYGPYFREPGQKVTYQEFKKTLDETLAIIKRAAQESAAQDLASMRSRLLGQRRYTASEARAAHAELTALYNKYRNLFNERDLKRFRDAVQDVTNEVFDRISGGTVPPPPPP